MVLRLPQKRVNSRSVGPRQSMACLADQPGISDGTSRFERVKVCFVDVAAGQSCGCRPFCFCVRKLVCNEFQSIFCKLAVRCDLSTND